VARFVLSDAAPLICLAQVDGLAWLNSIFGRVHITREVHDEILGGRGKPGEEALERALERGVLNLHSEWQWHEPQLPFLGQGEASCIRAAVNLLKAGDDVLVLHDDREARRLAASLSIPITGTAGVVGAARRTGLVPSASAVFEQLIVRGFRVSAGVVLGILEAVGESPTPAKPLAKPTAPPKRRRKSRN
jgi:predicted nucleic acid-binding protein